MLVGEKVPDQDYERRHDLGSEVMQASREQEADDRGIDDRPGHGNDYEPRGGRSVRTSGVEDVAPCDQIVGECADCEPRQRADHDRSAERLDHRDEGRIVKGGSYRAAGRESDKLRLG